jgi:rubrerythrin
LLADVKANKVFLRDGVIIWQCQNCGHLHKGKTAPDKCPVCEHPQAYFQELPKKNY